MKQNLNNVKSLKVFRKQDDSTFEAKIYTREKLNLLKFLIIYLIVNKKYFWNTKQKKLIIKFEHFYFIIL